MYSKFRSYYCRNFALVVSYASEGGFNDLTIDENSKILHIDPNLILQIEIIIILKVIKKKLLRKL